MGWIYFEIFSPGFQSCCEWCKHIQCCHGDSEHSFGLFCVFFSVYISIHIGESVTWKILLYWLQAVVVCNVIHRCAENGLLLILVKVSNLGDTDWDTEGERGTTSKKGLKVNIVLTSAVYVPCPCVFIWVNTVVKGTLTEYGIQKQRIRRSHSYNLPTLVKLYSVRGFEMFWLPVCCVRSLS